MNKTSNTEKTHSDFSDILPYQSYAQEIKELLKSSAQPPRALIVTYGCQMNENDSEKLMGMLQVAGFSEASSANEADIIIYNTCCVRDHAELRVFGNIGALAKLKDERPELILCVLGCMMQQKDVAAKLYKRFPYVDIICGTHSLPRFLEHLLFVLKMRSRVFDVFDSDGAVDEGLPVKRKNAISAFVTIMYGCNNFCTYCAVPLVRGRERSRLPSNILTEVQSAVASGKTEIMLLGQNVNSYGQDAEQCTFADLVRQISEIDGIKRIRFMTSHPKDLSDDLIDAIASCSTICKHIHLPVQSGSNRVLTAMNRKYTREHYLSLLCKLRDKVPQIEITTDIIVGFPTEAEQDFEDTLQLVTQAQFAAAYTFMYSPRKGTRAAELPQMELSAKKDRLYRLNALQIEIIKQNNHKYIGGTVEVLLEAIDIQRDNLAHGRTSSNKMVYFSSEGFNPGDYLNVKITHTENNSLFGKIIIGEELCRQQH